MSLIQNLQLIQQIFYDNSPHGDNLAWEFSRFAGVSPKQISIIAATKIKMAFRRHCVKKRIIKKRQEAFSQEMWNNWSIHHNETANFIC